MGIVNTLNQGLSSGFTSAQGKGPLPQTNAKFGVQYVANTLTPLYLLVMQSMGTVQRTLKNVIGIGTIQGTVQPVKYESSFIFPISPQSLNIQRKSLSAWYETQGSATQNYVNRIIDVYGLTPPIFSIRGTTGFNKYSNTNYNMPGIALMRALQGFIELYFKTSQTSVVIGNTAPSNLQWLDYFYGEYWNVVPIGPVNVRQDSQRPLWMYYELTLAGISPLGQSPPKIDTTTFQLNEELANMTNTANAANASLPNADLYITG